MTSFTIEQSFISVHVNYQHDVQIKRTMRCRLRFRFHSFCPPCRSTLRNLAFIYCYISSTGVATKTGGTYANSFDLILKSGSVNSHIGFMKTHLFIIYNGQHEHECSIIFICLTTQNFAKCGLVFNHQRCCVVFFICNFVDFVVYFLLT